MQLQNMRDGLLLSLGVRYEEDRHQFVTLSKQTLNSSSARVAVAELRNEGRMEGQLRGVVRLTARGWRTYKNGSRPYAYVG